jgi:hypothetical protein
MTLLFGGETEMTRAFRHTYGEVAMKKHPITLVGAVGYSPLWDVHLTQWTQQPSRAG